MVRQLDLKLDKDQFLRMLNGAGKKSGCRAILAIDALNETRLRNYWRRNLGKVIDEIKQYPNIALVVSVRKGFEEKVETKKLRKTLVHEEHRGFEFREWEAVSKFFKEFNLPLPEIPLLMPEFQNPLFLLLFCKAFQNRPARLDGKGQRQVFRGHEGATYIFESFVKRVSKDIAKQFGISNRPEKNIWVTIMKKIAEDIVIQGSDRTSEDRVIGLVEKAYPSISHSDFIKELENNSLIVKVPRYSKGSRSLDGFDFKFPFQKFSDHLIGRYHFKKYEEEFGKSNKNLQTAKIFFSKRRKLGKFLANSWDSRGVIEAFSIQCPEHLKGIEFVEVAPYLKETDSGREAFVESLIWRKPTAFSTGMKNTLAYINAEIIKTESGLDNLLNAFLTVAPLPGHPLNADFLHKHLFQFSMANRDSWWSTFLHSQYGEKGAVDRLIEWGWSEQDRTHLSDDSIRLCSIALCWFLTTPNRFVRDKATKTLVSLLTNRLNVVLELLKQFEDVNDSYVAERLYAVAYGCSSRSMKNKEELRALSKYIYETIFKHGNPPVHILLRDYARGVIEVALHQNVEIRVSRKKIEPPFNSKFPKRVPSEKILERKYYPKDLFQIHTKEEKLLGIWSSVMYNTGTLADFGHYILNDAVENWSGIRLNAKDKYREISLNESTRKLTRRQQDLLVRDIRDGINDSFEEFDTDIAQRWVFNRVVQLGWKYELHGTFDKTIGHSFVDRSEHKAERIGKKYQWIALHEFLARVSDNFEFLEETWSKKIGKYEGPWQLGIRDIDPTCTLKDVSNREPEGMPDFNKNEIRRQYSAWSKNVLHSTWLRRSHDLPDPKKILEVIDNQENAWVTLDERVNWHEETPPEHERYDLPSRRVWYTVNSYLVRSRDKDEIFKWAKQQRNMNLGMPESHEFREAYLGEFPWAPAFLYHYIPYYQHVGWTNKARYKEIPANILAMDDKYLSGESSLDCSTGELVSIKLLAKFIVDKMNLVQIHLDGRFFSSRGDLVAFDPSVFDHNQPSHVLIRKDKLSDFLKRKGYALFWTIQGEKNVIGGGGIGQPLGWLEIDGAYTLNDENRIIGGKRSRFKKSI